MKHKIIWDVDGVLYDIVEDFCGILGIPQPECYDTMESKILTHDQKLRLVDAYRDPAMFALQKPVYGASEIFGFETRGVAESYIHSGNFNAAVAAQKKRNLARDIRDINWSHVSLYVNSVDDKPPFEGATIVVEDKPENLSKYPPSALRILIDHKYNRNYYGHGIVRLPTLAKAIDFIDEYISNDVR